jgi:hypothetical protein
MPSAFKNSELDTTFLKNGYIVTNLLTHSECNEMMRTYEKLHPDQSTEIFFTTTHSFDYEYRQLCSHEISDFLYPKLKTVLDNYLPLYGNYMVKPKGDNSTCCLHQDWSFVDEKKFRTVNVWVALSDTDITNGCIHVVPGSHRLPFPVRGRNMTTVYNDAIPLIVKNLLHSVPLMAGQCVVFDSAIIHYSPNNLSNEIRVAASLMLYPAEAQLIHYVFDKQDSAVVTKYEVEQDFFTQYGSSQAYFSNAGKPEKIDTTSMNYESIKTILEGK